MIFKTECRSKKKRREKTAVVKFVNTRIKSRVCYKKEQFYIIFVRLSNLRFLHFEFLALSLK